jgi:GDP-mannose transporter
MSDEKKRDDFTIDINDRGREKFEAMPRRDTAPTIPIANSPVFAILSYCLSSILMTVTNKYVLSGMDYNLNFFLLCVQVRHSDLLRAKASKANECDRL